MSSSLSLPFSGVTPIARHHSYEAAVDASKTRGKRTREYLDLLEKVGTGGITDHQAAQMLGLPLSSVNSIRNGCGDLVVPSDEEGLSPFGKKVTKWRRR